MSYPARAEGLVNMIIIFLPQMLSCTTVLRLALVSALVFVTCDIVTVEQCQDIVTFSVVPKHSVTNGTVSQKIVPHLVTDQVIVPQMVTDPRTKYHTWYRTKQLCYNAGPNDSITHVTVCDKPTESSVSWRLPALFPESVITCSLASEKIKIKFFFFRLS